MIYHNLISNLNVGDSVVGPKSSIRLVQHHVIYIGNYNFIENKYGFGVRVITAQEFINDLHEITRINRFGPTWNYTRQDLVRYALSKVGKKYNMWNYNCEHFANEIQHLKSESRQADTGKVIGLTAAFLLLMYGLNGNNFNRRKGY